MSRQIVSLDIALRHVAPEMTERDPALALALAKSRERAIAWLCAQGLEDRRAADGRNVGIQATLATGPDGDNPIELYAVVDGHLAEQQVAGVDDPWADLAAAVREKLGFPLEPELFSNMLFAAHLGDSEHPELRRLARVLLRTFRNTDADGLYHFFTSLRFACDIDCTAMAARARLACGDLDLQDVAGVRELRRITDAILRSAAIDDVAAEDNRSHGKDNGPLRRHVFKVYLDDHEVQGRATDRGRKNNPAVAANALWPVLYELSLGLRQPHEVVRLREFVEGSDTPRTARATVAEIVAANVGYVVGFLLSGGWQEGCRYYPAPDAFLCFLSELALRFPAVFGAFDTHARLREAIERRRSDPPGPFGPERALAAALRAIAARNVGGDPTPELRRLLQTQDASGGWLGFDCLYTLGTTSSALPVHFGGALLSTTLAVRALAPVPPPSDRGAATWVRAILAEIG